MPYPATQSRDQLMLCSLDSFVAADSVVRIIDAFVRSLDMNELGFTKASAAAEGRHLLCGFRTTAPDTLMTASALYHNIPL